MSSSPSGAGRQSALLSAALPGRSRHQSRLVIGRGSGDRHGRCLTVLVAILGTLVLTQASRPAESEAGLDLDVGRHVEPASGDTETQTGPAAAAPAAAAPADALEANLEQHSEEVKSEHSEEVKSEHSEVKGTTASSKDCESFRSHAKNSKETVEAFYKKCIENSEAQFRETDSLLNEAKGKERDYAERLAELDLVRKSMEKVELHAKDAEVKEAATLKKDLDLGDEGNTVAATGGGSEHAETDHAAGHEPDAAHKDHAEPEPDATQKEHAEAPAAAAEAPAAAIEAPAAAEHAGPAASADGPTK